MFRDVQINPVPGATGNLREVIADSTRHFLSVEIECFVNDPPPPGLKPCPQCGTLHNRQFQSGQPLVIDLDDLVPNASGDVRLTFVDADERREVTIPFGLGRGRSTAVRPLV